MGNNDAFATFEEIIVRLYDTGTLTIETLDAIAETWRGTDIDIGGGQDLRARDGNDIFEICVEFLHPGFVTTDPREENYWDLYDEFCNLSSSRWDWR